MFVVGFVLVHFALLIKPTIPSNLQSCRDENNNLVDWFAIYKIPKIKDHPDPLIRVGLKYAYVSSENVHGWILSNKSINDSSSIPGLTLAPLYNNPIDKISEEALYILYNDQAPNSSAVLTGGHTKGVVYAGHSGGFWLVHSVPHYPLLQHYRYPNTGLKNGQSFLCITIAPDHLDLVGVQLMYNDLHIYANDTPPAISALYPTLTKAALGARITLPPWYHSELLVSIYGTTFQSFAKSSDFKKDLYSDWVTVALKVSLLVETWPNGPGRLSSSCNNPYRVENVANVKLAVMGESFSSHKDHSKWAISEDQNSPWVCIGDINRASSQFLRGGGTVCLKNGSLWQAYYNSVTGVESCPVQTTVILV